MNFAGKCSKRRCVILCALEEGRETTSSGKMKKLVGANGNSKVSHIGGTLNRQAVVKHIIYVIMERVMYNISKSFHASNEKMWWKKIVGRRWHVDSIMYSNTIRSTIIRFQLNNDRPYLFNDCCDTANTFDCSFCET